MERLEKDVLEQIDLEEAIKLFEKKQEKGYRICPRCGKCLSRGLEYNPMDIRSNFHICPPCGVEQGLEEAGTKPVKEISDYYFYNNDEWIKDTKNKA